MRAGRRAPIFVTPMLRYLAIPLACLIGCASNQRLPVQPHDASSTGTVPLPAGAPCDLSTPLASGIPGSPGHLIASARNPNGASELSMLMRAFVDDMNDVRTRLEAGKGVKKLYDGHRKIRCAWHTKPEERNEAFDQRALAYLAAVQAFDANPNQGTYNAIVANCISCHSQSCGGPIEYIGGLTWQ